MQKILSCIFTYLFFQFITISCIAATPVGYWKTVDDVTGNVKSIIKLEVSSGVLSGTIVKLFPGALTVCKSCEGSLKNKPILGMTVLYGLKQNSSNANEWSNGTILDPKNGKTYRCTITNSADGNSLNVRGYIGISLLGRSQTWLKTNLK